MKHDQTTGLLGGLYALVMLSAYGAFRAARHVHDVPIVHVFRWLPAAFRLPPVSREFVDLMAVLALCLLVMAGWDRLAGRWARWYTLLVAAASSVAAWETARRPLALRSLSGATGMELVLIASLLGLMVPWIPTLFRRLVAIDGRRGWWACRTGLARWFAGAVAFALVLTVARQHPFYATSYYRNWRLACSLLFSLYLVCGLPYAIATNLEGSNFGHDTRDPGFMFLLMGQAAVASMQGRNTRRLVSVLRNRRTLTVLRDLLVKLFFVPLMVCFYFANVGHLFLSVQALRQPDFDRFYAAGFWAVVSIDVTLGLIGYLCASRWLGNKSTSVDATFGGWLVALMCYPPFNGVTSSLLPYGSHMPGHPWLNGLLPDTGLKVLVLVAYGIYVWATMALGLRFSNLTNRGIVKDGPYAFVRHPAYAAKNLAWWGQSLRSFTNPWQFMFLAGWNVVYILRALTEERHLKSDPCYRAYCEQVPRRFLPGIL